MPTPSYAHTVASIRKFLTYGVPDKVGIVEQYANVIIGGIVDGETHAAFKDRAAEAMTSMFHPYLEWLASQEGAQHPPGDGPQDRRPG